MITSFTGDYHSFLSNTHKLIPARYISYEGFLFPSVENAFQAAKFPRARRREFIYMSPFEARRAGRSRQMSADELQEWDAYRKYQVMRELIEIKFRVTGQAVSYANALDMTGNEILIEGNDWGDVCWGMVRKRFPVMRPLTFEDKLDPGEGSMLETVDRWVGDNNLGRLLMEQRAKNREGWKVWF